MRYLLAIFLTFFPSLILATGDQYDVILSALSSAFTEQPKFSKTFEENVSLEPPPQVDTDLGTIIGATFPEAHGFYSVPYAEKPIGEMRFAKARLVESFPDSQHNGSEINWLACHQRQQKDCVNGLCFPNLSEDCLVLNIHVPRSKQLDGSDLPSNDKLPVIFWIHGGGFQTGSATSPLYDGRYLSNVTNTIVVAINYRLGSLGFLALHSGNETICNQGFHDQQLALQWVNKHIEHFGGDKDKVTIVGNSAGAQSVMFHLMSAKSDPYFKRAILQSHPAIFQYPSFDEALQTTYSVLNITGCNNLTEAGIQCLRNLYPINLVQLAERIMAKNILSGNLFGSVEPFGMVLDGDEFTENPIQFVQSGRWMDSNRVSIIGTNIEEMNHIPVYIPKIFQFGKDRFENLLKFALGDEVGAMIAEKYDSMAEGPIEDYKALLGEVVTDGFFVCPNRAMARLASAYTDVHVYSFAHHMNDTSCEESWSPGEVCNYVYHSSENSFVFRSAPLIPYNFSADDVMAADQFSYFWGNFAASGDPNSAYVTSLGEFPNWPKYIPTTETRKVQFDHIKPFSSPVWTNYVIVPPVGTSQENYKEDICDFWDSTKYYVDLTTATTATSAPDDTTTTTSEPDDATTTVTSTEGLPEETTTGGAGKQSASLLLLLSAFGVKWWIAL